MSNNDIFNLFFNKFQMCKFVYDFYAQKVAALSEINRTKMALEARKEIVLTHPVGKTGQHPGDDRDSDDEMEGKTNIMKPIVNEIMD
jgi:hypothetical protein